MKIKVGFGNRKIGINVKKANKAIGLMFKTRKTENLLFDFDKEGRYVIHSFFVFFPFLALWLDKNNRIIEKRIIKPFEFHVKPKKQFKKLIEMPLNSKNKKEIDFIVGRGKV